MRKIEAKFTPRPSFSEIKEIFEISFPMTVASNTYEKIKVIS